LISAEQLRDLVDYDPTTGVFTWKARKVMNEYVASWNTRYAGTVINNVGATGYAIITIAKRYYRAHRLAWLYVHGTWPSGHLDHINRIRTDNRIENIRPATVTENMWNAGVRSDNTSGRKGVGWDKSRRKWTARARINGVVKHLGRFDNLSDAAAAYDTYAIAHQGMFAPIGVLGSAKAGEIIG
jgi:HNH endonuclease/AP2 domain